MKLFISKYIADKKVLPKNFQIVKNNSVTTKPAIR